MTITLLLLVAGFALLIVGAEALVRGASKIAAAVGIPPLIIGLTIVAYGTSAPEMAVSVGSSLAGQADIAVGNVVGSNIFNVLFILGISALITPLVVAQQLVRVDVPIMIGVSVLAFLFGLDGQIGRIDGIILFTGAILYTTFLIRQGRKESKEVEKEYEQEYGKKDGTSVKDWVINVAFIVGGLGLLVLGARWLVESAVTIAEYFGVSQLIIGLTIVAGGTSLPEVATSVIASIRGERDIAVGNVVGSNIFNILSVLGLTAVVAPNGVPVSEAVLGFDALVMLAVAVACLPIFFTGNLIARWEGALFFAYYIAYTLYLILAAAKHDALPLFNTTMMWFVIPLTALTIGVVTVRQIRSLRKKPA